jgi:D-aminopeptidase
MSEREQAPTRARELGIEVGGLATGAHNAITDVAGVRVGHTTLIEGTDIRTGVTAVVPEQIIAGRALPANLAVGNGYGKFVGATQLVELGTAETPILLTSTLSTFRVADALVTYMLGLPGRERLQSINPLVGETNDGYLSDIRARPITEEHVLAALAGATADLPPEGTVGAGTGTGALGYKAGIGTSSRLVAAGAGTATVGVLVQANFGGVLRVRGVPVPAVVAPAAGGNSCMIVVATDARLDSRQLGRVARRAIFAMGRVGADYAGGSGDYAVAFATAPDDAPVVAEGDLDAVFAGVLDAVEEALLNSLFMATTVVGYRGHVRHAVDHARVRALLG